MSELGRCPLCDRLLVVGWSVNRHHLRPVLKGGGPWRWMHKICHSKVHSIWSEAELRDIFDAGDEDHYWATLQADDRVKSFVRWVSNKPPEFRSRNRMVKDHKRKRRR